MNKIKVLGRYVIIYTLMTKWNFFETGARGKTRFLF